MGGPGSGCAPARGFAPARGISFGVTSASPHKYKLFFLKSETGETNKKTKKYVFFPVPWTPIGRAHSQKLRNVTPYSLLKLYWSPRRPPKPSLGWFHFLKSIPQWRCIPNVSSCFKVALRMVFWGDIGSVWVSGVDQGAALTVSARVRSFFCCFFVKKGGSY